MKIKYNKEIISGALFTVIGAILWLLIPSQIKTMEKSAITARTMPQIAIGGMFIFAIGLLLEGLLPRRRRNWSSPGQVFAQRVSNLKCVPWFTRCFWWPIASSSSPWDFLCPRFCWWWRSCCFMVLDDGITYAIPIGMVGVVYYIFRILLHVSLP